jgi:hypothetical protein
MYICIMYKYTEIRHCIVFNCSTYTVNENPSSEFKLKSAWILQVLIANFLSPDEHVEDVHFCHMNRKLFVN